MRAADHSGEGRGVWDFRVVCKGTKENGDPCELLSCHYSVYCPKHLEQVERWRRWPDSPEKYKKKILRMDKEKAQKQREKLTVGILGGEKFGMLGMI